LRLNKDRRGPRRAQPLGSPHFFAGLFVEADDRFVFYRGVDDENVLVKERTGGSAHHVRAGAYALAPQFFAFHGKGEDAGLAEEGVDALAVGNRCGRSVAVLADHAGEVDFGQLGFDFFLPDYLALGRVEAEDDKLQFLLLWVRRSAFAEPSLAKAAFAE